jgi:hypothetical protein
VTLASRALPAILAAIAVLIEAAALGWITIAIAHVLLVAILIPARSALLAVLILLACLIGHESLLDARGMAGVLAG